MIEVRTPVRTVKEVIGERILLGQLTFGQIRRIVLAEDEALIVAPGNVLIPRVGSVGGRFQHAVIYLQLLVPEAVLA